MTVPTPVLDDRSYDQILAELKARIPVYTPEWTDHGPSDPGITLLELLAYLGESLLYRFNQIPDQTRLWLLHLLQVPPYPPRRATGLVAFDATQATGDPPAVSQGTQVTDGSQPFKVGNDVTVLPVTVTAVVKAGTNVPTDPILLDEYRRVLDAAGLDEAGAEPYQEVVLAADPGAPGFQPLDVGAAVDRCLWIAVHAASQTPPDVATSLFGASSVLAQSPLVFGIGTDTQYPTIDQIDPCDSLAGPPENQRLIAARISAESAAAVVPGPELPGGPASQVDSTLVWQVSARRPSDPVGTDYLAVSVARDTTNGLRRDGVVALQLPAAQLDQIGVGQVADPDLAGVDDSPPALADRPPVLFWLRAFPRQGVPEIGRLRWVGANAADIEQVADAAPEFLGIGNGLSGQAVVLSHTPVVPGSLQVQVREGDQWQSWQVVDSFAASQPTDRHLTLDPVSGTVRCGDSLRGQVFPIGAAIRAAAYSYGGGRAGVVKAGAINQVVGGPDAVKVTNPLPTAGGEEGETITSALQRIPGELARHDRAVTEEDFRELARIVGVGRAECLPRFDPVTKSFDAAGVVTVMVWPTADPRHPNAPVADATLLSAVCSQLDARRLVTTELYVIPATYHPVAVSIGLAVKTGYSAIGVRRWVEMIVRQYLAPLPPFGPDGNGWPLGHRVHGPELEAAVVQVEGVDFVEELKVADLASGTAVIGTVELAGWEVPELREITVVTGSAPDPGSGGLTPPPGPAPVPVPVPKDEC
jgi:hypothetical protein